MPPPQARDAIVRKRRAHLKSRNGCLECKRRHHKCDEHTPRCGQCERLRTHCSFEETVYPSPSSPLRDTTPPIRNSATQGYPVETSCSRSVDVSDIRLYNNFLLSTLGETYPDFRWDSQHILQFTSLALSKLYMLHALLAVSAVQIYEANPSQQELLVRASFLQNIAVTLVKPHCEYIEQEESIGMLFFAGFTSIYSFGAGAIPLAQERSFDPLDKLLHSSQLVRGIRVLLAPHWRYLAASWVGPILNFSMAAGIEEEAQFPYSQPEECRSVRSLAFGLDDKEWRSSCLKAVDDVFRFIEVLQKGTDRTTSTRLILTWAASIDTPLESLLRQHKPVALILLAYYAVLMNYGRDNWWVSKWPRLLLEYVDSRLGEEWEEFLAWPKSQIWRG